MPRGFELGDGGYFLLDLNRPERVPIFFQFYRVIGLLSGGARFDVVDSRVLRLVAEALGSAVLIAGVWAWARARVFEPGTVRALPFTLFCLLGALLSTASRSLSYNDVTNLWTYAAVGGLFWIAAAPSGASLRRAWTALGIGVAIGMQMGAKFPVALALGPVAAATLGALGALPHRERLRLVLLLAAGVALVLPLFVATSGGVQGLVDDVRLLGEITSRVDYAPLDLLRFYVAVEVVTYAQLGALALVFLAARWLLGRVSSISRDVALAGALAASALWLAVATRLLHPFFVPPELLYHAAFLVLALVAFAIPALRARPGSAASLAPLLLLVALPLLSIAGTNVPPSLRLPTHALPIFAALGVLAFDLRHRARAVAAHATLCVALVALTSVVFVRQHLVAPYGLPHSIFAQTEPVAGLDDVRVDPDTRRFLEGVGESMRAAGFRPGDPLVAFDFMPGLVYFLDGVSPGLPIYLPEETDLACFALQRAKLDAPPWLAFGRPLDDAKRACLAPFAFPTDFRLIGSHRFPYERVYESFDIPGVARVDLYAPRAAESGD